MPHLAACNIVGLMPGEEPSVTRMKTFVIFSKYSESLGYSTGEEL